MKVAILTTPTPHHLHFVRCLAADWSTTVVLETTGVAAPFDTRHPFEDERDAVERAQFGAGDIDDFRQVAPTHVYACIDEATAGTALADLGADVAIVFGTRILSSAVLTVLPPIRLNLHGGDPERYRGLDSHLWAIYHGDRAGLVTTLHEVHPRVDAGPVVGTAVVDTDAVRLPELRAANTECCIGLARDALAALVRHGAVVSRPQSRIGRYYSFMPACLKDACVRNFEARRWRT